MSDRAVSTVLDVGLCLLLVAAAVATVASVPPQQADPAAAAAGETAATLGTATATVSYSLSEPAAASTAPSFPRTEGPGFQRRVHGTLATLLARAATSNLTVTGERVWRLGAPYREAVREVVAPALSGRGWRAHVVARWRPYPGSHLGGRFAVGQSPPAGADVHVARLRVPSGLPAPTWDGNDSNGSSSGEFTTLGSAVGSAIVGGLFPPERTGRALRGAYPLPRLTRLRYRRLAVRYGTDVREFLRADDAVGANENLSTAMGERVTKDLRRRFDDPATAADRLAVATVTIVVRTWSP